MSRSAQRKPARKLHVQENIPEGLVLVREWRDKSSADRGHPIIAGLASAVASRLEIFLTWSAQAIGSGEWLRGLSEAARILTELGELVPWLPEVPEVPASKAERIRMVGNLLSDAGASWDTTREVIKAGFERPGAPATARSRAVAALELKLSGKTWRQIGTQLCPEAHTHTPRCGEPIRRELLRLKDLLCKYQIAIPPSP